MKRIFIVIVIALNSINSFSQDCQTQIQLHRTKYKNEFLEDEHSPLKKQDLKYLRFYKADSNYVTKAQFTAVDDTIGFDMQTHNGVIKRYFVYGFVEFDLKNTTQKLFIYQSEKLKSKEGFEDYLFIPFTDETNYQETFGGGRYLDFRMDDIQYGELIIDFNKAYNPYCAFKEGYACPIPPKENDMKISIEAGEKLFGKKIKEN